MKEKILKLAEECGIKITFVCGKPDECPSDDNCCHHSVPSGRWIKDGMIETFYAKAQAQALREAAEEFCGVDRDLLLNMAADLERKP